MESMQWLNNDECKYKFDNGGKSNKTGQFYFTVLYTGPPKQIIEVNKMLCNVVIAASLPSKIIFNANKQLRYVEAFQPLTLVAMVLPFIVRT